MGANTTTLSSLKRKADKAFSLAIRYRDGEERSDGWWCQCISCGKWVPLKQCHAGHFQSRRFSATRYSDENVNSQCSWCNTFMYGNQYAYGNALDLKYGKGTAKRLERESKQVYKLTRQELEEVIHDSVEQIRWYERQS